MKIYNPPSTPEPPAVLKETRLDALERLALVVQGVLSVYDHPEHGEPLDEAMLDLRESLRLLEEAR
jgi:hypothetical protein